MATQASFAGLPPELIRKIAAFTPAETVLALLLTSRQLNQICDDAIVWRANIVNHAYCDTHVSNALEESPNIDHQFREYWDYTQISGIKEKSIDSTSKDRFKRYALALSLANQWTSAGVHGDFEITFTSQSTLLDGVATLQAAELWLVPMSVLHHPVIRHVPLWWINGAAREKTAHSFDLQVFYTLSTMLAIPSNNSKPQTRNASLFGNEVDSSNNIKCCQTLIASSLLKAYQCGSILQRRRSIQVLIPPPFTEAIPFGAFMEIPLPFLRNTGGNLVCIPSITSSSFLEDGEWVGYYSQTRHLRAMSFDAPMISIYFHCSPSPGPDDDSAHHQEGITSFTSTGEDSVGKFTITGTLSCATGCLLAKKQYLSGHFWEWRGEMGPFGIFGKWGKFHGHFLAEIGNFWLWKREWSYLNGRGGDNVGDRVVYQEFERALTEFSG